MPISCERITIATGERTTLPAIQSDSHRKFQLECAQVIAFCNHSEDQPGVLRFIGQVGDLTYICDDQAKTIEREQSLLVTNEPVIVFDDKTAFVFRRTNVISTLHKNVSANQT